MLETILDKLAKLAPLYKAQREEIHDLRNQLMAQRATHDAALSQIDAKVDELNGFANSGN